MGAVESAWCAARGDPGRGPHGPACSRPSRPGSQFDGMTPTWCDAPLDGQTNLFDMIPTCRDRGQRMEMGSMSDVKRDQIDPWRNLGACHAVCNTVWEEEVGGGFNPSSMIEIVDREDSEGIYSISHIRGAPVTANFLRDSKEIGVVPVGTVVHVVEVGPDQETFRRGRLEDPPGWITLSHAASGCRFAEKVDDLAVRRQDKESLAVCCPGDIGKPLGLTSMSLRQDEVQTPRVNDCRVSSFFGPVHWV